MRRCGETGTYAVTCDEVADRNATDAVPPPPSGRPPPTGDAFYVYYNNNNNNV